jgi:GMP synthase (glutamine-hydrolysing)
MGSEAIKKSKQHETVVILDFGSQYTQLITRRVRELGVFSEILPYNVDFKEIENKNPVGIILSGGPSSVYEEEAPRIGKEIFSLNVPVLGICYGLQLITYLFDGKVAPSEKREFGLAKLKIINESKLFKGVSDLSNVWMSHGDKITELPQDFESIAQTDNSPYAAIHSKNDQYFGLQFHPEVLHSEKGKEIINNFLYEICSCKGDWSAESFIDETIRKVREEVGDKRVLLGLSGGVDSSVVAVLLHQAIGDNLHCIFINNGLLRYEEAEEVETTFRDNFNMNLTVVDATKQFYDELSEVIDPETKRKKIGNTFIDVFEQEAKKLGQFDYLAQGTLYPDVIESVSFKGPSATIKSHHNVGGLPEKLNFKLVEPLRELFKDEVREVGRKLDMPEFILGRHPFPGPGLAVRIMGAITEENVELLQKADAIYIDEIKNAGIYDEIWQAFAVLLPVQTVGVMGDQRTYEKVVALRAVTSADGMTADWYPMPYEVLGKVSNRIINEVRGVNRVVYDVSSKPPATIEWE